MDDNCKVSIVKGDYKALQSFIIKILALQYDNKTKFRAPKLKNI